MEQGEPFEILASDGYRLGAARYPVVGRARATVVIAGATGVPQGFYRRFAVRLARAGLEVATVDYRGIGRSRCGPLRGFVCDYLDWGQRDLDALVGWALARGPTVVVGHSFGGQAFGLLSQPNQTLGLYTFGTGAGWHGYMPLRERPRVLFLWNVIGPLTTRACGYLPFRRLGMGEDLPLGVYRQWRAWCRSPGYWFDDPALDLGARFARVTVPLVAVNASDDAWASPRSAAAFMRGYRSAQLTLRVAEPAGAPLGHMGYFRVGAQQERLWDEALAFIDGRLRG